MLGRRSAAGENELRRVFTEHARAVYAFLAYSVDPPTAEDLTSATFERVVRAWHRFDPAHSGERTWILAIARNLLTDHYRATRRKETVSADAHPGLLDRLVSDEEPLDRRLSIEELKLWLAPLSDREREIVALRYGADLEGVEIARLLDLTPGNVHQILSRSLRRLRELATAREAPDQQRVTRRRTD
ncbi:MAG TPA: sigma-70 family RNA polymerase sigma factor [Solirubrobacteraceae bacterium]|nr:sigma-70 family RNA polymerase sigma factor [Solirubrobacteraceae bacterium]